MKYLTVKIYLMGYEDILLLKTLILYMCRLKDTINK
jgi:hypothetical protein